MAELTPGMIVRADRHARVLHEHGEHGTVIETATRRRLDTRPESAALVRFADGLTLWIDLDAPTLRVSA